MELKNAIYRFVNKDGDIIYIGKAKRLRNRLNSHTHLPLECYEERERIEFCTFETEDEMDLAERYFIPKVKPKYNSIFSERTISFDIPTFDNVEWYIYGTKKEIETQIEEKAKELRRIKFESEVKTFPQEIERLKNEIEVQWKIYRDPNSDDDAINKADHRIDELRETLRHKRELLFEFIVGEHPDNIKHGQLMVENDVFSLEELFEKDIKKMIAKLVAKLSNSIDKNGWYDVELLTYEIVKEYHFTEKTWDNSRNRYLLDMGLKGLEDGRGTAYEVVERVLSEIEGNIQSKYGTMVQETIVVECEHYFIWEFDYKIPRAKVIKRPTRNDSLHKVSH